MIPYSFLSILLLAAALFQSPGVTLSGQLKDGQTGQMLGGDDVWVVAYVRYPGDLPDVFIMGYTHPDKDGKWSLRIPRMQGNIYVAGFRIDAPDILAHREVILFAGQDADLGLQTIGGSSTGSGNKNPGKFVTGPIPFQNKTNREIAAELTKLVRIRQQGEDPALGKPSEATKEIEGLWDRNGRTYRIADGRAILEDTGAGKASKAAAGTEVMRNIKPAGNLKWSAETLWQLESSREWAPAVLILSSDGRTLTRQSPSPWAGTLETVELTRKKED